VTRTGRFRACALGAVLFAGGCAARPPVAASPPSTPPPTAVAEAVATAKATLNRLDRLAATVDALLASPTFSRATVGVVVQSLDTGETLYSRNGRTWLVPASTMKVLTTVAAASRLGWDYRFETRLVATGPIVKGVLDGDLIVVGTGDPTINRRHPTRVDSFDRWARALKALGIVRVNGHVIGDDSLVESPGWGIGWAWDDLVEDYGAAVSALQYNENVATVTMGPGITPGAPPVVYLSPSNHGLLVDVQATTSAEGTTPSLAVARQPGTRFLEVRGRAPWGSTPLSTTVSVANPTLFFTGELRQALLRHGIAVDGTAVDIDQESDRARASEGTTLLIDQSAPLREIATEMLAWSINLYAESLVAALDRTIPAGLTGGVAALRSTLEALGVPPDGYTTRDGSGLSRNDYASAETLVAVLAAAWRDPSLRAGLLEVLPVTGGPGMLERRLTGTPAAGRVHAKSGSMSNVRGLTGIVETTAGEPLAFAVLANGFDARGAEIDERVDALLVALVALPR
jgi:serine-type D-Ala-D-Ala carboxypeptidase/endopeptidase (penicillin-binding protein 4)